MYELDTSKSFEATSTFPHADVEYGITVTKVRFSVAYVVCSFTLF
jgi:hypothetical protein